MYLWRSCVYVRSFVYLHVFMLWAGRVWACPDAFRLREKDVVIIKLFKQVAAGEKEIRCQLQAQKPDASGNSPVCRVLCKYKESIP